MDWHTIVVTVAVADVAVAMMAVFVILIWIQLNLSIVLLENFSILFPSAPPFPSFPNRFPILFCVTNRHTHRWSVGRRTYDEKRQQRRQLQLILLFKKNNILKREDKKAIGNEFVFVWVHIIWIAYKMKIVEMHIFLLKHICIYKMKKEIKTQAKKTHMYITNKTLVAEWIVLFFCHWARQRIAALVSVD